MGTNDRHRIKRQIFEIVAPTPDIARALFAEAGEVQARELVALIDRACSGASAPDRVDRIDRVELDLGRIPRDAFAAELRARLARALPAALDHHIRAGEDEHRARAAGRAAGGAIRSALELFERFARTGSLPWWADARRPGLLEDNLRTLAGAAPHRLAALVRQVARDPRAARRLAVSYDGALLAALIALLVPSLAMPAGAGRGADARAWSPPAIVAGLVRLLEADAGVPRSHPRRRALAWQAALQCAAQTPAGAALEDLCKRILIHCALATGGTYRALVARLHRGAREAGDRAQGAAAGPGAPVEEIMSTLYHQIPEQIRAVAADREGQGLQRPASEPVSTSTSKPDSDLDSDLDSDSDAMSDLDSAVDELYVDDAGLVLLWPFLGRFFSHIGLLEDNRFVDEAARHRAVGLLHHLATGAPTPIEYRLSLAKALCGMEVTGVLELDAPVNEAETAACEDLLTAVIQHASILKNMSIPGFRGTLLLRPGILSTRDDAWLLRVERASYDVVLERFPWTFEWIRLPWMQAPMRVEWL